jgi:RsiW-degrading membrane proteinase PrsW (M82 family)
MEILTLAGFFVSHSLITILSGIVTGVSLAAGFELFKIIKERTSKFFERKKNNICLRVVEDQILAGATS